MRNTEHAPSPLEIVPLPDHLRSIQPGGGVCYWLELCWGKLRRWYLRTFRKTYLARMESLRSGSTEGAPHAILDPRDLKYCRNQCSCAWNREDDPFAWRDKIPLARWGLAESLILGGLFAAMAAAPMLINIGLWPLSIPPLICFFWIISFFRDPKRSIPAEPNLLVAPADGKVVEIAYLDEEPFTGGPAIRISIFLSIFNVHINRSPCEGRVIELRYAPGLFLDARNPQSALKNESMWIGIQAIKDPYRRYIVRQIAGLFARRIVCDLRPGETIRRGAPFGMIKLGSRTEIIIPQSPDLELRVQVGQKVKAGTSPIACYTDELLENPPRQRNH